MKQLSYILYLFIITALVAGCQRRPLEDELGDLALVPIHIDWSESALDMTTTHNVSVWFFPHDGSSSFEYRYEGNLTDMEARLPKGGYSIIVFNETVDFNWTSLQFEGSDKYETFRVSARPDTFRGLNARGPEMDARKSPDALAVWSTDKFEVSPEMVRATAMGSRAGNTDSSQRIDVTLKPLTKIVKITAYVQNLTSALRCSGTLTGAVGEVMLSSSKACLENVAHMFIMNDRIYKKENPNNGYIHANILVFSASSDIKNTLTIDFQLTDGKTSSPDSFDVTEKVTQDLQEVEVKVGADAGGPADEKDHPIVLPEVDVGGDMGVGVDDWQDNLIQVT